MVKSKRAAAGGGDAGYLTSAAVFAGATALWAVIVRDDPYYRLIDIGGARVPLTMLTYLLAMPFAGFLIGRWRYHGPHQGGAIAFAAKLVARAIHFTYAHTLIVLFTVAIAMDYFLELNIDEQVRSLDDRMFDIAARFAPWLCAYLAGFNLGRATRRNDAALPIDGSVEAGFAEAAEEQPQKKARSHKSRTERPRAEPVLEQSAFLPSDASERGDLAAEGNETANLTASGLPAAHEEALIDQPGFLPPQDFNRLRPGLSELR